MCGNGIRCLGKLVFDRGLIDRTELARRHARRGSSTLSLRRRGRRGRLGHGGDGRGRGSRAARCRWPATRTSRSWASRSRSTGAATRRPPLSMGNPHLVLFVEEDPDDVDVHRIGPLIEHDERFPERTNVEFVAVQGRRREGPGLGARRRRDDGVRHGRVRRGRRGERGGSRAREGARRGSPAGSCGSSGSRATRSCSPVPPSASPRASSTRRGWRRSRVEGRQARRVAAAVPVRRARPQARGQARRGRRRDLARRRRPRPADARARRRGDARGGARPLDAPVPELLRRARVPSGGRRLVRPPLRRRARPRDRGHGADRLEGGDRRTSRSRSSTRATRR